MNLEFPQSFSSLHSEEPGALTDAIISEDIGVIKTHLDMPDIDVNRPDNGGLAPFLAACYIGNVKIIQLLIERGADIHSMDNTGYTGLHFASREGNTSTVELLFSHKVNYNMCLKAELTPLDLACTFGHISIVKSLLDYGARLNQSADSTSLFYALEYPSIVSLLLEHGADPNEIGYDCEMGVDYAPLHTCAHSKNIASARILLQYGANINIRDKEGRTPLMIAREYLYSDMVSFLIDNKADIHAVSSNGTTALNYLDFELFFSEDDEETQKNTKMLLDQGADPNIVDNEGMSPLMKAADKNLITIAQWLLEEKADPNAIDKQGRTALMFAVKTGSTEIAELLLQNGANPNILDDTYNEALAYAVMQDTKRHNATTLLLLLSGANVYNVNKNGDTLLHIASASNNKKVTKVLLKMGVNVNRENNNGKTSLILASGLNHRKMVKLLLKYGADPNLRTHTGLTALKEAREKGHDRVVTLLLCNKAKSDN